MSTPIVKLEDEIDLRRIVRILVIHWRSVGISILAGAILGLCVSLLLPRQYQASSIVLLTSPEVLLHFDPRIETGYETPRSTTLSALSLADSVLDELSRSEAARDLQQGEAAIDGLRRRLSASASDVVLRLTVTGTDPDQVAALANAWAEIAARRLNGIYDRTAGALELFASQAEEASQEWDLAEQALVSFQATNPERILQTQLAVHEQGLAALEEADAQLRQTLQDILTLKARMEGMDDSALADARDNLMCVLLVVRTMRISAPRSGSGGIIPEGLPSEAVQVEIPFPSDSMLTQTAGEQARYLQDLADSVDRRLAYIQHERGGLEAEIYSDQGLLAQAGGERERLQIARSLSLELYQTLVRSAQEGGVAAESNGGVFRVASQAFPPSRPVGPRKAAVTFVGAFLGVVIGITLAFSLEWWQSNRRSGHEANA
jgi:LPS O-antigen subunit length determinant protein (WzzB/FepE family)